MTTPTEHLDESQKLTADAYVDLFEVTFRGTSTVLRMTNGPTVTWQGNTYDGQACQLSGERRNSDGEEVRPTLTIMNPMGVFKSYVAQGILEQSLVVRKRLLRQFLEDDVNLYEQRMWTVGRVASLTGQTIVLELRNLADGPNYVIPGRMYYPPEFPLVRL